MSARTISKSLVEEVTTRLSSNKPIRRTLPNGGRIHIDRQLPFVVVYRPPIDGEDAGTSRFVTGEASYVVAPSGADHRRQFTRLLVEVTETIKEVFGACLVIEVWSGRDEDAAPFPNGASRPPAFRVVVPRRDAEAKSVEALVTSLRRIRVLGNKADVELVAGGRLSPPNRSKLSPDFGRSTSDTHMIGIELRPIYRNGAGGDEFVQLARTLHRQFSRSIQRAAYEFALHQTTHRPRHYQALGRKAFVKAVLDVDRRLTAVSSGFDLLLMVSPVNTEAAYRAFRRSKWERAPALKYRPLDVDPSILKRQLFATPIERVEDPTLAAIFSEKQRELSLQLDLLSDRLTPRFLYTGVTLYGAVTDDTLRTARAVLSDLSDMTSRHGGPSVGAEEFAAMADVEIAAYREVYPEMDATVQVRSDLSSLMVSRGHLLVGSELRIPRRRCEALIQHEVGTHIVTYWNGANQRLSLLRSGLAGHDELQEGLAVLSEYLVAGLTPPRLRTIAARVVAAGAVLDGAGFIDTFRLLRDNYQLSTRNSFLITTRVHRGGGFVKDAIYLRGLQTVTEYLADGGRFETLLTGKIAASHVAVVEELQRRGALNTPRIRPAYLDQPDTHYRLEQLRKGLALSALAER